MTIEVKSFTDRKRNRVQIGDTIGYFDWKGNLLARGTVNRITKAGYHISVYIENQQYPWYKPYIEKI